MEVPYAMLSNVALLFFVAPEPYLYHFLQSVPNNAPGLADAASVAYVLDFGGMFFMPAALGRLALKQEKVNLPGQQGLHRVVL